MEIRGGIAQDGRVEIISAILGTMTKVHALEQYTNWKGKIMKRFSTALLTAATLSLATPAAFAAVMSFDDVTEMQAANGSEVYTSDGKLFGVLTDVDLDGAEATFIIETAASSNIDAEKVFVTAEEGKVMFEDDQIVLQATETDIELGIDGNADPESTARFILID